MGDKEVLLRKLESTDSARLAALANNKKIWDNVRDYFPHPYTEKDAEDFIKMALAETPPSIFAITYHEALVGIISLVRRTDVYRKTAEIGYWIGQPYWNKGIAENAVKLIIRYGFEQLDLVRIDTGVFEFNRASCRVLEKCGFEKEAVFNNAVIKNNRIVNEIRYGIIKNANAAK